ncbi:MAG: hypothetical protein AB7L90_08490 [Hyphomicrobiaceae bacterium]
MSYVRNAQPRQRVAVVFAGLLAMVSAGGAAADSSAAVSTLLGSWSGNGRITYTDGASEGIHCNAYYSGGGNELKMAIQCQSEKNPIHVRSQLRIEGSRASGSWEERTFNASGSASGSVGSGSMSLNVSGGGFTGTMSVSFGKLSHSVSISTKGIAMSRATMSFSKR